MGWLGGLYLYLGLMHCKHELDDFDPGCGGLRRLTLRIACAPTQHALVVYVFPLIESILLR